MRPTSSCTTCRSRKKKCIPARTAPQICELCHTKNLACNLPEIQHQQHENGVAIAPMDSTSADKSLSAIDLVVDFGGQDSFSNTESPLVSERPTGTPLLLDPTLVDELIDLYFDLIHNKQQILFQRQQFLADRRAGVVPEYILLGIAALVARFSSHPQLRNIEPQDRGRRFLQQAIKAFHARTDAVSLNALQGCIVLEFDYFVEGMQNEASLFAALAIRMAQLLNFPTNLSSEVVRRETEIRLFWNAYMMDSWCSSRERLPRQMICHSTMPKPLDAGTFENMASGVSYLQCCDNRTRPRSSIWGEAISLNESYVEILEVLRCMCEDPIYAFETDRKVQKLILQLDHWLRNLPPDLQNNHENFHAFARRGHGGDFAVLHILYHHQNQLLYYQYLHQCATTPADTDPQILAYVYRCKSHAEALSDLMWLTNTTRGSECLWSPVNGHLLAIASTIHLHSLLMDQDSVQRQRAKRLLEQNYVLLLQLQVYWPSLKASLSRLQSFHRSCQRGELKSSFQMDTWMFKFLNDYDNPVTDRVVGVADVDALLSAEADDLYAELYDADIALQSDLYAQLSYHQTET